MFASYVFEKSSAEYTDKLFLIDTDNLNGAVCYSDFFAAHGFQIIRYEDDLQFRVEHATHHEKQVLTSPFANRSLHRLSAISRSTSRASANS